MKTKNYEKVIRTMNKEQQEALFALIGEALATKLGVAEETFDDDEFVEDTLPPDDEHIDILEKRVKMLEKAMEHVCDRMSREPYYVPNREEMIFIDAYRRS